MASNGEAKRLEEKASDIITVGASPPDDSSPLIALQQPNLDQLDAIPTPTATSTSSKPPLEQEDKGEYNAEEKELRIENNMLRKENEELRKELQKQFEALKMSSRTQSESTNNEVDLPATGEKIVNNVYSQGQKPKPFHEAECAKDMGLEMRKGELEQGKKISGESCSALGGAEKGSCSGISVEFGHTLSADAIRRYSRQLLVPSFGVAGQERLLMSSALVVGCGGLGSPIALYLAAAGVGCLGLVDHDIVELSNLHRQVIHTEAFVGKPKVKSAASACRGLNSSVQILEYVHRLDAANAVEIISNYPDIVAVGNGRYRSFPRTFVDIRGTLARLYKTLALPFDVVLDATDNLPTRYLLNDACVATGKPLVSGAALGVEGQVTVYNHKNGPCYRCLFPIPPPQGARQRCSDNGVIGVVPGIIGTFQALEALKIAGGVGEVLSGRMLLLDALSTRIHMVKLRSRSVACVACGDIPQISRWNLHSYDYERFTQSPLSDEAPEGQHIIPKTERLSSEELKRRLESGEAHVLLDVRDAHEYAISRLPNSLNIPFSSLKQKLQVLETAVEDSRDGHSSASSFSSPAIYVVCRRGNDSQRAVQFLKSEGFTTSVDLIGGLESWVKTVNNESPFY